jgi:RNA polymerase sigma-70 factor (ECF subfamily)
MSGATELQWRNVRVEAPLAETTLVARCRACDETAFDLLVHHYGDRIHNYIRRMVYHPQDAEDLTQEVFVRAYTGMQQFDGRSQLSTWLFRIATNLCIDYHRQKKRRPEPVSLTLDGESHEGEQFEIADHHTNALDYLLTQELQHVVEEAITNLSPKLKTVLLLYDMEGLPYEEISRVLSLPIGTVKSRLFLARNQIRQRVETYLGGG